MDGNHYQYGSEEDKEIAQPMTINFNVSEPVGIVKTTNAKS